jgi:ubiquinone/menaquinone biosynthesis C-methylase UbiE
MDVFPTWFSPESDLMCPVCHGPLQARENQIECKECYEVYWIRDGIPYFVNLQALEEFEKEESEFHSHIAAEADKAHGQATLRAKYLHNGFLAPILELPTESLLLDVACGSGIDIVRLAKQGYRVIGVDIAPGMIRIARRKIEEAGLSDHVFLCVASAGQLPFHDTRFQATYICAALHHMPNPTTVLCELARVTQSNGIVSIGSEPNAWIYKFRSIKHSKYGRRLLSLLRDDYTIGKQSPGDRETAGWSSRDWPRIVQGTGLELVKANPVWYLNGIASLLGLHSLPRWLEAAICRIDKFLTRVPLAKDYSVKWNVITRKKGGRTQS